MSVFGKLAPSIAAAVARRVGRHGIGGREKRVAPVKVSLPRVKCLEDAIVDDDEQPQRRRRGGDGT